VKHIGHEKSINPLFKKNIFSHLYLLYKRGLFLEHLKKYRSLILSKCGILQLQSIFICPSHTCNANCVHCYEKFIHEKFPLSLTTDQIKNVIDQFDQLGGSRVFFCSGEFLLRDDAIDLVKYVRSKKIVTSITTNGLLLDENMIDELKSADLSFLVTSIDSADPDTHDQLRGVPGCHEKVTNGMRMAIAKGIETHIWTYVSRSNYGELDDIIALGESIGVGQIFVFFPLLSGNLFNSPEENLTFQERESFRKKYNKHKIVLLEFPTESSVCRGGGKEHVNIMPSGDVTFCPPVPYSYGNINSKSLKTCLEEMLKDHEHFCTSDCTGQCIINFPEYRQNCNAEYMYE